MNFGKFIYQQKKKQQDSKKKQKTTQVKEVKFRPNIDDHDYDFKMKNILKFLSHGDKVKATVQFRGREMARRENGQRVLDRLLKDLEGKAVAESRSEMLGNRLYQILSPVKSTRRQPRPRTDARRCGEHDAETEDPPRRREAVQEDRDRQVQAGEGVQEPHPDEEGRRPEARARAVDDRLQVRHETRPGDAALRLALRSSRTRRQRREIMPRVKRGPKRKNKRSKTLALAKGYYGTKSKSYRMAKLQVEKSLVYAYRDRKAKKRDFRGLWIIRINAAARENEISY